MSEVIHKYLLEPRREQSIAMPLHSRPLCVQVQRSELCVWVTVDAETRQRREIDFLIVGTGHEYEWAGWHYLGTAQTGDLVWHVFYRAGSVCP